MRTLVALLLLMLASLGGCIGEDSEVNGESSSTMDSDDVLSTWLSPRLTGPTHAPDNSPPPFMERPPRPDCAGENCHRQSFTIPETDGRDVAVAIEWEGQDENYQSHENPPGEYLGSTSFGLDLAVFRGDELVADGIESFHYASVAVLNNPGPGEYVAEVVARWGNGKYLGVVRLQDPMDGTDGVAHATGLPDLVMLPPDHLTIAPPLGSEASFLTSRPSPGCGPDEVAEDQERRCLRFAGVLGNQGPGDLELRLQYDQATGSIPGDGRWEQTVFLDGEEQTFAIGPAQYHPVHGHFHILEFVETTLYEYDASTETRGDDTGFGRKTGFCVIDGGLVNPLAPAIPPKYHGNGCCYIAGLCQLDMATNPYFVMGMSSGWYDIYPWWRADQYVEVSGLEDGIYELVSVINPNALLEEMDVFNNEASTVFRLQGNVVTMLDQRTQADVGPHPDADWGYEPAPEA